jgi:hypothetical protein
MSTINETWFLLYGGTSADGRGFPKFQGRTTDPQLAFNHYTSCQKDTYSCGKVVIVTDSSEEQATPWTDWESKGLGKQ